MTPSPPCNRRRRVVPPQVGTVRPTNGSVPVNAARSNSSVSPLSGGHNPGTSSKQRQGSLDATPTNSNRKRDEQWHAASDEVCAANDTANGGREGSEFQDALDLSEFVQDQQVVGDDGDECIVDKIENIQMEDEDVYGQGELPGPSRMDNWVDGEEADPNFAAEIVEQAQRGGASWPVDYINAEIAQNVGRANAEGAVAIAQPRIQNAAAVARGVAVAAGVHAIAAANGLLVHNWQATKTTLKDRFSFMFCNEILADVHFVVGRGEHRQRIPAHKFVLSVGSAVFDAMFNGAMRGGEDSDIDLPDVEPAAFLALLKFLYSDDVQIGPESVMTTLYTAKKYAVPALENSCVDFLKRNLNADNAFMLLTQARLFDEPQLAALCLEMIDKHTAEALSAEGFCDIDLETLCAVLERDTLRIREAALYQAVVRWSVEECHRHQMSITPEHQRSCLGRSLTLIRFPLMTVEEFAQSAAQSGILCDREIVNLFLYFTVNPKPTVNFLDVPRCCVTGKEQVVNRFQRIEGRWGYSGTPDRIKFTVDRRIFVVGFGLYGSIHGPTEYQVTIQIIHCGTGKVLGSNDTTFSCDGSSATSRVLFKEPVEISPCVTYIASACLKGPDSHYGTKGLRRIVHQSPSSGCVTFQFTYAAGNNNGTSVEDGQIPDIIFYTKLT